GGASDPAARHDERPRVERLFEGALEHDAAVGDGNAQALEPSRFLLSIFGRDDDANLRVWPGAGPQQKSESDKSDQEQCSEAGERPGNSSKPFSRTRGREFVHASSLLYCHWSG